ncbi:flagellar hook-length control protein FliK [Paenibacillus sp. R14(2021)]|uniref:flagellar hook-length control protein FliK n=1 Tax=Paenibacillus sp. R14(2021) TaxID=2859228 RepID=UPI001C615D08|nr:flagellar hook-length control protein FliK [Paenibacillus sp. R14(2021)]
MSMSIGQLVKGLLGDAQAGDSKALELKVGQTVRGVMLKATGDGEAIIQINGTPVQAKLETPLQPGQATLLQVQPQSQDGALVLKQVDPQTAAMPEASVKEWVKAMGLPDTKWAGDLVRDLRGDGVPLTRELASQLKQALAVMPKGGDVQSWMGAAALAVKRGLPMTGATIGALQQVLSGAQAHALLEALERGLAAWSGTSAGGDAAGGSAQPPSAAQAAAAKLQALLAAGAALMREAQPGGAKPAGGDAAAQPGAAAGSAAQGEGGAAGAKPQAAGMPAAAVVDQKASGPSAQTMAAAKEANTGSLAQQTVNDSERVKSLQQTVGKASSPSKDLMGGGNLLSSTSTTSLLLDGKAAPSALLGMQSKLESSLTKEAELQTIIANKLIAAKSTAALGNTLASPPSNNSVQSQPQPIPSAESAALSAKAAALQASAQPATANNWVSQMMKWLGVDHERLLAAASASVYDKQETAALQNKQQDSQAAAADTKSAAVEGNKTNAAMVKEQPVVLSGQERTAGQAVGDRVQLQANQLIAVFQGGAAGDEGTKHPTAESLKSALLTIAAGSDVPPSLRDTAQQLVSHITGQQLLLSPEKTSSLFSHVTMFIPMKGPDGSQTASVHIQTRRGSKGELDADNCRLLFDLRMRTLGDTVVDVQVVNKIVNLNLWNDHPAAAGLVESSRSELTEALASAGYQLLTLRSTAMPERLAERINGSETTAVKAQEWSSKPYKGVDFRV